MFFKLLSGLNRSGQFGKQVKHFGAVPAAFEIAVVPFSNLGVVPDTVKRIDDPALCFERNRNFMLTKELHNERFAVDLPVYHLLSRHNISFGLTNGGIVTGLSFLCQLLFTDFLLRPPFISLPLPFRSNGGIVGFCFFIPSKQICKSQISPPVRDFHTLIENPLDLTPDAMLQRGQPFQNFFKSVQNKLEYAATGHTAPELIAKRADASKDNMGLTSFKGAKVRRGDVTVAKNYMTHDEISTLNLIVNMYLDYAELQAKGHHPMHMADWESKLGDFLRFNGREVLENFGTVKREVAEKLALEQYEQYDAHRRALEAADDVDELTEDVKRLKP